MKKLSTIFLICILSLGLQAQMVEHTYHFNDLETTLYLDGVDGWTTVTNQSAHSNPELRDWHIETYNWEGVVSLDQSNFMMFEGGGTNIGSTASRLSTDSLPFDFSAGGVLEVQWEMKRGWWKTYFGFGYDSNDNGITLEGIENTLQFEDNDGGIGIHLSGGNPEFVSFVLPDGSYVALDLNKDSLSTYWYIYKMTLDLDAYNEQGSVSLSYKKNGLGDWVSLTSVLNYNLGLTPGSGDRNDPAMWTKLLIHGTNRSCIDNIKISQPNTNGLLYQFLVFDPIPDHLTTDQPITINATSNQGLTPSYSIVSGPATISGDIVTLTGEPGTVTVMASQPGNDDVAPAVDITASFHVIDPQSVTPNLEVRNSVEGEVVRMPDLMEMQFVAIAEIAHPELLHIQSVKFNIDGITVDGYETNNGFYVGNWLPPSYGNYTVDVEVLSSEGVSESKSVSFEVVSEAGSMDYVLVNAFEFTGQNNIDTTLVMPGFVGTYSKVTAVVDYGCPCTDWDLNAFVRIRGANGEWMELFKYITPYGVACDDEIDITDFVSQLQGMVDFEFIFPQSSVTITFVYEEGTPEYNYSWIDNLWNDSYSFGDVTNLQPVEPHTLNFASDIEEAYIRIMTSGHGWGDNNSNNAAEFYEATHNIKLNGNTEFQQHLWQTCNPNPTGCQPQNGTWYYNRAGWCPGSIPMVWEYDITSWLSIPNLLLEYEFSPDYIDYCHPNHPDCVTGVTCDNCLSMSNPSLLIGGGLVTFSNEPLISSVKKPLDHFVFEISPNPTSGLLKISSFGTPLNNNATIQIFSVDGALKEAFSWDGNDISFDISNLSKGAYLIRIVTGNSVETKKIIRN